MIRVEHSLRPPGEWESLWESDPRATLFLHPRWMEALVRAYTRTRSIYLIASDAGRVAGLIPVVKWSRLGLIQFLSLPFGTYGGPLLAPGADLRVAAALAAAFRDLSRSPRCMRFEMCILEPSQELRDALAPELASTFQDFRTHVVDLTQGMAQLWRARYRSTVRECVRAAQRARVTVAVEEGEAALAVLHALHLSQGGLWKGFKPYSLHALRAMTQVFSGNARIYIARREGEPLAACLFLEHAGREIHPYVSGASLAAREHHAFHLLIHTALGDACARGFRVWNFGASGGDRQIEYFKESFGAEPRPVLRCFHMAWWARRLRKRPAWDQ